MKTKQEILKWWKDLGKETEDLGDYRKFWDNIDKKLMIDEKVKGQGNKQRHKITIMSGAWKYPIRLYFYNLECYRIVGF